MSRGRNGELSSAMTRRDLMVGAGLVAAAGGMLGPAGGPACAAPAHTFRHGEHEISILSDGHLSIPRQTLARETAGAEIANAMTEAGQTGERVIFPTNVTLIRTGSELILVDVGSGANFMETAGKLSDSMAAAGIDPATVTKVVYTHGHPDHLWGTLDDLDEPRFPNATYMVAEAEWNLWMGPNALSQVPPDREAFVTGARRQLGAVKAKVQTFKPGGDIASGIRALDTGGHTQGHVSLEVAGGREALIALGDALTHPVISFAHPEWKPASDHDPDRAVATRKALLDRLTADKCRFIGYHLPFPGLGMAERKDGAWRLVAAG